MYSKYKRTHKNEIINVFMSYDILDTCFDEKNHSISVWTACIYLAKRGWDLEKKKTTNAIDTTNGVQNIH